VEQELYALRLSHFALRVLMHVGALLCDQDPDRVSFTHTVAVLQRCLWRLALAAPELYPLLRAQLLVAGCQERVPARRVRFQARVLKQARSQYLRKCYADLHAPCFHRPFLDIVTLI